MIIKTERRTGDRTGARRPTPSPRSGARPTGAPCAGRSRTARSPSATAARPSSCAAPAGSCGRSRASDRSAPAATTRSTASPAAARSPRSASPHAPSRSPSTSGGAACRSATRRPRRHSCPHFYLTQGAKGRVRSSRRSVLRMLMKQEGVVIALRAARRRPPRRQLRQRPVHDRPVPRLRLLRGRAGLTTYAATVAAVALRSGAASGSASGLSASRRSSTSSATRSARCAERWSAAPTARAASWPWPDPSLQEPPGCGSAPCRSRTWSATASGSPSTGGRSAEARFARGPGAQCSRPSTAWPARLGPPTEFEALTAAAFARAGRAPRRPGAGGGGHGRPAGRHQRAGCRRGGDHQRAARSRAATWATTLAAIGAEKAAIIKPGNLAVTGAHGTRPAARSSSAARQLGVPLRLAGRAAAVSRHPPRGRLGRAADRRCARRTARCTTCRSACWGATRPATRPSRSRCSTRCERTPRVAARRSTGSRTPPSAPGFATAQLARAAGAAARHALRRRAAGRRAQPGRRARPGAGARRAGDAPLPARLRRDARQAGAGHAPRPGPAGAAARSSRRSRIRARDRRRELLDAWRRNRRAIPVAPPPTPGRLWSWRPSCAAPRTSRSWWPGSLYLVGAVRGMLGGEEAAA